jgi:hypothetical protein
MILAFFVKFNGKFKRQGKNVTLQKNCLFFFRLRLFTLRFSFASSRKGQPNPLQVHSECYVEGDIWLCFFSLVLSSTSEKK